MKEMYEYTVTLRKEGYEYKDDCKYIIQQEPNMEIYYEEQLRDDSIKFIGYNLYLVKVNLEKNDKQLAEEMAHKSLCELFNPRKNSTKFYLKDGKLVKWENNA